MILQGPGGKARGSSLRSVLLIRDEVVDAVVGVELRRFGLPRSVARLTVTGGKLATEILPLPEAGA